jgi:Domain of unknown function (DUF1963)
MRTTQPPSHDIALLFPGLADLRRTTVRLHPRREPGPGLDASRIGGRFKWPAGEQWPRCDLPHQQWDTFSTEPPDDRPYVPVLQLHHDDVPELPFPTGRDIFQLLWCPSDHADPWYVAVCRVFWWAQSSLVDVVAPRPVARPNASNFVPRPCSLHPERVVEYPDISELPESLREAIHAWEETQGGPIYQYLLSTAPGTKIGGHPNWFQDPEPQECDAGHAMDHLLTISDVEFDGGSWPRWLAVEEADAWNGPTDRRLAVQGAIAVELGMGSVYVFTCRACRDLPIRQVYQR